MEDRIYRSLRMAQERELQNRPTVAQPDAVPAHDAPAPSSVEGHVAPPSDAASHGQVHGPLHGQVWQADTLGFQWFARGLGADRPRISVVGTLSLSVLISAGLFAAQMIVKPRHKLHPVDESVAADSNGAMRLAARQADDAEDDNTGPVSVPSRFRHVHAPTAHARTHSTHAVALDEQSDDNTVEGSHDANATPAAKTHHRASGSHAVQHAAEETEAPQPSDADGSSQPADQSAQPAAASCDHGCAQHDSAGQAIPSPPAQGPAPESVAASSDHSAVPSNLGSGYGQPAYQAPAQPIVATNGQAPDVTGSRWPAPSSVSPVSGAVQVSAEASNASTPTLTIVPGRPDNMSMPSGAPAVRTQPIPQQAPVDPVAVRTADASAARPGQPANVSGLFQDRQDAAAPAEQPQVAANPLETLDRTKVMSFQFRNAPWSLVLAKFANATGLELRMQAMPEGTFNRWDSARYTPTQTLAILNSELAKLGCQAKIAGTALCVVAATPGDTAIPVSASLPANVPAASASSQLPQYPGAPGAR